IASLNEAGQKIVFIEGISPTQRKRIFNDLPQHLQDVYYNKQNKQNKQNKHNKQKRYFDDKEKISRKFNGGFKATHSVFSSRIQGISVGADRERYGLLMMHRLAFLAFMQEKGFLNGEKKYLQERLQQVQKLDRDNPASTSYQYFLFRLFDQGLNAPS